MQLPRPRPRPRDHRLRFPAYLEQWGTHPSWSRLLGSPSFTREIEERLTELLGAEDTLVLPTITLIHMSVIPVLAGSGTIYVESRAHKTIYEGCQLAGARGATVKRFQFEDADDLERLLKEGGPMPRLICVDGVNSMTGNATRPRTFARLAREYDALLYVDDAHGFGVIGERSGRRASPVRQSRQQHRQVRGRDLRPRRSRRRPVQVVLVAGRVPDVPARAEASAQDRCAAVPATLGRRRSRRSRPCSPGSM